MVVRSSTGYWRRFSLSSARTMLLATAVDGEPIEHEHGAPLRLVAPGRRGYDWVKWVTTIEVSAAPFWLNWPLPLH
jgi:DMSO/TMAO reductase YedYZ molybdopterin-dependent catalytic subunit